MNWVERLNRAPGRVPLAWGDGGGEDAGAEVLHWAYSPALRDNVPHRHAYFEVCLVGARGAGRFVVEGAAQAVGPGDLFIARPGVLHRIVNDATPLMELFWVSFLWRAGGAGGEVGGLLSRFADADRTLVVRDADEGIGGLWRGLRAAASEPGGAGQSARLRALMAALLLGIAEAGAGPSESLPLPTDPPAAADAGASLARHAVRYIHDNLGQPLAVEEVAAQVGLSPRHLSRLLTRFCGVAPAAYIEQARMERARSLLLRTDDPIKQVAALLGYRDVHHFTRVFSRTFGCPPGRFRATGGASDQTARGPDIRTPGALV